MFKLTTGRKLFLGLALAGGSLWAIPGLKTHAADPVVAVPAGQMTIDELGKALEKYGTNTITQNGQTTYSLTVTRGKWNINVIVSLSPNQHVIWMTNQLASIPDLSKASSEALAKLLEKNEDIGPMYFGMVGPHHSLILSNPVPNHDMTAKGVQDEVDALITTVLDTEPLWRAEVLIPNQAPATPAPAPANPLGH